MVIHKLKLTINITRTSRHEAEPTAENMKDLVIRFYNWSANARAKIFPDNPVGAA